MACILKNCVFIHIPRTGSTWVRVGLRDAKIPHTNSGAPKHDPTTIHAPIQKCWPEIKHKKWIFSFVRNPVTHLQSLFVKRPKLFRKLLPFDIEKIHSWEDFIAEYVKGGKAVVTKFSAAFLNTDGLPIGKEGFVEALYVEKMESNPDAFINFLKGAGEKFDENIIRGNRIRHVGARKIADELMYTQEQLKAVLCIEQEHCERFGYSQNVLDYKEYIK